MHPLPNYNLSFPSWGRCRAQRGRGGSPFVFKQLPRFARTPPSGALTRATSPTMG
jgi:hypothetical protein